MSKKVEKILTEPGYSRYSLFPIHHQDIWQEYKKHMSSFWTAEEIDLSEDQKDWDNMNDNERFFIKQILAFFNNSDSIVNENLCVNFIEEVKYPEAKCYYGFQMMMENIHSETYSLLIDTYIKDSKEKSQAFNALENFPAVRKKAEWALNWIESDSFVERLIAFVAVEGIFFSGSFCSIFWLKNKNLMPGLCFANTLINRDESLHTDFAILLYNNHIEHKLSDKRLKEIILSALTVEKEFITESLPVSLIGMNSNLMKQYLEFVTDGILQKLGCSKEFNVENPFKFMEQIAIETKGNFFEGRTGEYQKANMSGEMTFEDEDF